MRTDCIFCRGEASGSPSEHILPESLGGHDVLPDGFVCRRCNNYFATNVEQRALQDPLFLPLRVLAAIPNKRGRPAAMMSTLGRVHGGPLAGLLELEPRNEEVARLVMAGDVRHLSVAGGVSDTLAVCRLLLKIGLELLAADPSCDARARRYDAARAFAREPSTSARWYFIHTPASPLSTEDGWMMEVVIAELGLEVFHLRLGGTHLITPLESGSEPSAALLAGEDGSRAYVAAVRRS